VDLILENPQNFDITITAVISQWPKVLMVLLSFGLIYLGVAKKFEPLLLVPIGIGILLTNLFSGMGEEGGLFYLLKKQGLETQLFPLLMFLGLGALTDFSALIKRPVMAWLGAAAQVGIFSALIIAVVLGFDLNEAGAIAIIGGADGPTAIYVSTRLADEALWGPVAVSAYSYMALVPIIQPPIMRLLTTSKERATKMEFPTEPVPLSLRLIFPLATVILTAIIAPQAVPLIGMLMFGNLLRESGVTDRLASSAQNELINIVTILLGLTVGGTMTAEKFLDLQTLGIFAIGLFAFSIATAGGVLFGKLMYLLSGRTVNPLIGAAGVSAVPMSARVVHLVAQKENPGNYLLMQAIGPNVAGVLGSAVAAGILLRLIQ